MDQTEFQQLIKSKLERDCPDTIISYLGEYKGQLAFSIDEKPAPGFSVAITGFPVYALVALGDLEHYRLVSDLDLKITDHFFLLYGRLSQLVKLLPKILHLDLQPPSELPRCVLMEAAQS